MKARAQDNFFDVLIDRLIIDVRREFEANLREKADETPPTLEDSIFDEPVAPKSIPYDDLLAKMIGFRTRLESAPSTAIAPYQISAPRRFEPQQIEIGVAQAATAATERKRANPEFNSSAAQIAFMLLTKSGAKFFAEDLVDGTISPDALKRERRRVLLTLHPDRVPETDRAQAHHAFLEAAEAFSILAEATSGAKAA